MKHLSPPNIEKLARTYYEKTELGNKDIQELFGGISISTVKSLKQPVVEEMIKNGIHTFRPYNIDTITAYKVWGFEIDKIIEKLTALKKLERLMR